MQGRSIWQREVNDVSLLHIFHRLNLRFKSRSIVGWSCESIVELHAIRDKMRAATYGPSKINNGLDYNVSRPRGHIWCCFILLFIEVNKVWGKHSVVTEKTSQFTRTFFFHFHYRCITGNRGVGTAIMLSIHGSAQQCLLYKRKHNTHALFWQLCISSRIASSSRITQEKWTTVLQEPSQRNIVVTIVIISINTALKMVWTTEQARSKCSDCSCFCG